MSGINVLLIIGSRESSFTGTLAELAGESSPDGIRVSVFDSLDELPPFSETAATVELPGSVDALRNAAVAADAVLFVTHYYAPVPATVHNAIDWLTMRWNDSELHEKPLAVMGYSADCYRGVWSHRQSGQRREISESRIIEPITVGSLPEAVAKLAGEVSTVDEPTRASAFCRGAPKHRQWEPARPTASVGESRPWMDAPLADECTVRIAPDFARDTNCLPPHHRGADVVP
jgi:NADPH-dependent FMN reductase